MDTMRGSLGSLAESEGYDPADGDAGRRVPPAAIGQDERRMQVRAYNHWASQLEDRNFPAIDDLDPAALPDFGPYSVLLDFSAGVENPGIAYLGEALAAECGVDVAELHRLADVPSRSLLTRITDHYLQILANQAPIGFEAEFVNQRGSTILYRGILLPYSSDDDAIDFIYGVINWKELPDAQATDALLLEIDQALEPRFESVPPPAAHRDDDAPLTDWADGPGATPANDLSDEPPIGGQPGQFGAPEGSGGLLPRPSFGFGAGTFGQGSWSTDEDEGDEGDEEAESEGGESDEERDSAYGSLLKMPIDLAAAANRHSPIDLSADYPVPEDYHAPDYQASDAYQAADYALPGPMRDKEAPVALLPLDPAEMGLGDWLATAREMAAAASNSEDRTRGALYDAIGLAYDFSLAADEAPDEFGDLLADAGLKVQDRAPMTPVVKLVFGAQYDKTRLTEYAAALTHARRLALPRGTLGEFLGQAEGGLKGVVKAERQLRKEEAGKVVEPTDAPREALARKLRALPTQDFAALATEGREFALVMIRRTEDGNLEILGEVPEDVTLIERAARRLIG